MGRLTAPILVFWAASAWAQQPAEGAPDTPPADAAAAPAAEAKPAEASPAAPAAERAGEPAAKAPPPADPNTSVEVKKEEPEQAPPAPDSGDEAYRLKIAELEGRVNDLKEKIFRTKTRLSILKETVLSTSIAGAEAMIVHRNEMGSSFRLEKVSYSVDGQPQRTWVDKDGDLDGDEERVVFDGPITPGNHTISVVMTYRGNGFGIFSYLRGYVFNLRSSHTFHAEEGKLIRVRVVGYEKGGITTDLKDRPDIRFEDKLSDSRRKAQATKSGDNG